MHKTKTQPTTNTPDLYISESDYLVLEIAIPTLLYSNFDYLLTETVNIEAGMRVLVPFGKSNKTVVGIILKKKSTSDYPIDKLKSIITIIDKHSMFKEQHLSLLTFAANYYKYPLGLVLEAALPVALRKNEVIDVKYINDAIAFEGSLANDPKNYTLSSAQKDAIDSITSNLGNFKTFCLFGVTGSGKTEVYLQAIAATIINGKQALILIPEIGLTPQTLARFKERFSVKIALLHSKISQKQKAKYWIEAANGSAKIIIGTRSASLVPLKNPGLFIVDEEHDGSFKQHDGFRYSAKDILIKRASQYNIPIVLGSATPSLETLYNTHKGKFHLLELPNRVNALATPQISLLDIRHNKLDQGISLALIDKIQEHLKAKGQVILFLNRRGYAPILYCNNCAFNAVCKNCDSKLIVHFGKSLLICHHCNIQEPLIKKCPKCNHPKLLPLGQGTERIEDTLKKYFPNNVIVRIDKDTTNKKNDMDNIINAISENKVDIIIGTQMIAKGHHFANITLVGIIDIDAAFYSFDFRAIEKMGQLIIQVAGRAGREERKDKEGCGAEVLLQTTMVSNKLLQTLIQKNYLSFANLLLQERKESLLPPFTYQALIHAESKKYNLAFNLLLWLKSSLSGNETVQIMGPIPAPVSKKKNTYKVQLLLQAEQRSLLHVELEKAVLLLSDRGKNKFNNVKWSIDVDPQDM